MIEEQRQLTREALDIIADKGFALAGSGAIREHGLIARPTKDIDLFCPPQFEQYFPEAATELIAGLKSIGYSIDVLRQTNHFLSVSVSKNDLTIEIDLGIDYRTYPLAYLSVGPVIDIKDAVANKTGAAFGRGEARDFLDLDSIRQSGLFGDDEILNLATENDPGLELDLFAESLTVAAHILPEQVEPYLVSAEELDGIKARLAAWKEQLKIQKPEIAPAYQSRTQSISLDHKDTPTKNAPTPESDRRAASSSSKARQQAQKSASNPRHSL